MIFIDQGYPILQEGTENADHRRVGSSIRKPAQLRSGSADSESRGRYNRQSQRTESNYPKSCHGADTKRYPGHGERTQTALMPPTRKVHVAIAAK